MNVPDLIFTYYEEVLDYAVAVHWGDFHAGQDSAHDAFAKLLTSHVVPVNARGWLFAVVRNNAIDQHRRQKLFTPLVEEVATETRDMGPDTSSPDAASFLTEYVLARLPPSLKRFVECGESCGWQSSAMREQLGKPSGYIRSQWQALRRRAFRERWKLRLIGLAALEILSFFREEWFPLRPFDLVLSHQSPQPLLGIIRELSCLSLKQATELIVYVGLMFSARHPVDICGAWDSLVEWLWTTQAYQEGHMPDFDRFIRSHIVIPINITVGGKSISELDYFYCVRQVRCLTRRGGKRLHRR